MARTKQALIKYVDTATALAESIKRNIQHDGKVDNKTVLALNEFIIAANDISSLTDELTKDKMKLN
jgi:hypothetical protein